MLLFVRCCCLLFVVTRCSFAVARCCHALCVVGGVRCWSLSVVVVCCVLSVVCYVFVAIVFVRCYVLLPVAVY